MTHSRKDDFGAGFHDRLSKFWPEPREQLHHGGWQATELLFDLLDLKQETILLDYCCGEGGTLNWLASQYPQMSIIGFDIVELAIKHANQSNLDNQHVQVFVGDGFEIPMVSDSVDVIIGQDPDAFGYQNRLQAFQECARVLKRNGKLLFHHYVIADETPADVKMQYDQFNSDVGFEQFAKLSVADYRHDLEMSGFKIDKVHDMSQIYHQHILEMKKIAHNQGEELDYWTTSVLKLMDAGYKIGALFEAVNE